MFILFVRFVPTWLLLFDIFISDFLVFPRERFEKKPLTLESLTDPDRTF